MVPESNVLPNALGPVRGLVLDLAPEIGPWLFGTEGEAVTRLVQQATLAATGASEPGQQLEALADPEKAAALRLALARIAAGRASAAAGAQAVLLTNLGKGAAPVPAASSVAYGAPLVSFVVLLTFALVMVVALTRTMPTGAEPVLNVLLGTLGAMATSVVGYWVGSSAGSARKEERLASLAERV